jgi:hypothetical protein
VIMSPGSRPLLAVSRSCVLCGDRLSRSLTASAETLPLRGVWYVGSDRICAVAVFRTRRARVCGAHVPSLIEPIRSQTLESHDYATASTSHITKRSAHPWSIGRTHASGVHK